MGTEEETTVEEPHTPSRLSLIGRYIRDKGLLSRKYIVKMLHSSPPKRKYHVYGARLENEGIMIGNSKIFVDESDNLQINNEIFKGTPGLFELIFTSNPTNYTTTDLRTFKKILITTNAHKKNYTSSLPIHKNTSIKYRNIISKLFPTKKISVSSPSSQGFKMKNIYDTNIIYYNDINKLVNRMRLLYEAKEAGHTGVDNEIIVLTNESKNKGYIL